MKCEKCGREYNDESLNYCPNCGAELVELKKRCKKCGNVTKVEALFCPKCGSDISSGEEELVVVHKQKKENVNSAVTNEETCELIEDKKSEGNKYLLALIIGVLMFLGLSLIYSVSGILATRIKYPNIDTIPVEVQPSFLGIIQMVYSFPLIGMFIYVFGKDLKKDFLNFKKNTTKNFSTIAIGIFGCLMLTGIVGYIYNLLGITGDSDNQETINTVLTSKGWVPMVISVVFIAPFTEEMLFRKTLYGTCKYKFSISDPITIALITFVFALIHVASLENLKFIFQYLPLAFVITYSYHHSKNIFVPMAIHFLNNLLSVLLLYLSMYVE